MQFLADVFIVSMALFMLIVAIAIPILTIILLLKLIKNIGKKNNDCRNCPYRNRNVYH